MTDDVFATNPTHSDFELETRTKSGRTRSFCEFVSWVNSRKSCLWHCLSSSPVLCVWLSRPAHRYDSPADLEDSDSWWDAKFQLPEFVIWIFNRVITWNMLCWYGAALLFATVPPCFPPLVLLALFLLSVCPVADSPDHLFPSLNRDTQKRTKVSERQRDNVLLISCEIPFQYLKKRELGVLLQSVTQPASGLLFVHPFFFSFLFFFF